MSTKFISVNGYEKIERIKGSKKVRKQLAVKTSEKKTKRMDNILSMLYYIVVVPATFFSGIVKFITPSKKNKRKSFSRKKFMYNKVAPTLAIILLVLTVGYWTNWIDFGLNVQLDGQTVASVSDSGVIQHAKEITNDKLNKDTDASFTPVYQIGVVNQNETSSNAQTVSNAMVETDTSVTDDVAGLYVNDELIGVCSSATDLQNKLDEIINKAKKKYKDNTEISFYNEVKVESGIFNSNSVEDTESLIKKAEKKETKAKDTPKEHKPLTMVKPTSEDVAKVAEAMKEEEILPPSENDTPEMAEKRRTQVIKKYGDMPISQAFSDEKICELLSDELESMNALREQIRECFGIVVTEDENGEVSETSESGITSEQVEKLLSFYIHEADENADDCGSVTLDKFLTKFIPYMVTLYQIYQYDGNQISAAGAEMTNKDSFGAANININNAEALLCVLKELNKAA